MNAPSSAMILAAGFGTRMGALTKTTPKPLLKVAGRAMLDHVLDHCAAVGVNRAVVNLHYLGGQIRTHLAARREPTIAFSEEMPVILDTGGGVKQALPSLGSDPFYVANSDSIWVGPNPLESLARAWAPEKMDALLLLVSVDSARAYTRAGDFHLEADLEAPVRRGNADRAPFIYSGAHILAPGVMADAPEGAFSLNLIWDRLLAAGRLKAVVYPGAWVDVGTPDGLAAADAALAGVPPDA